MAQAAIRNQRWIRWLSWLGALLILKVTWQVLAIYSDYFPVNLNSEFWVLRQADYRGLNKFAFYIHIIASPAVLLMGLFLLSHRARARYRRAHRIVGRCYVGLTLLGLVPSAIVMACYAWGGLLSTGGFLGSSLLAGWFTAWGWRCAVRKEFSEHRRWMWRSYVVICSAVTLRVLGGLSEQLQLEPMMSYQFSAWLSWIVPLCVLECCFRWSGRTEAVTIKDTV
jgi:hypothetical protein